MMSSRRGFTILELLITITLVMLLMAIGYGSYERFKERGRKAVCISHLRTFHSALSSAITENGEWPQIPIDNGEDWTEDKFYEWWFLELAQYGIGEDVWLCPSDDRRVEQRAGLRKGKNRKSKAKGKNRNKKVYVGSYVPSKFEPGSNAPFLTSQPWMAEKGNYHRTGGHILMPDGEIATQFDPFAGR